MCGALWVRLERRGRRGIGGCVLRFGWLLIERLYFPLLQLTFLGDPARKLWWLVMMRLNCRVIVWSDGSCVSCISNLNLE